MQIDIGFGDVVEHAAEMTDYPTILELATPRLWAYPRETVVAEKYEAMVKLGGLNSRMKDFFDLWLLARQFEFDGASLATAVSRTFANRKTAFQASARGGVLRVRVAGDRVLLGGQAVTVLKGELL